MRARLVMLAAVGAMILAGCTGGTAGSGDSGSTAPEVSSAAAGEVAGGRDNFSRCEWSINADTTANVQLLNQVQRVGVSDSFQLSNDTLMMLKQDAKQWESSWTSGLADEGEYNCKSIPWKISNDNSRVYDYWGGEWTGDGDDNFYWGHTQDISGAAEEPFGWVRWACVADEKTDACPEAALNSKVTVNWDAENDSWDTLERNAPCEFSANAAIGCYEKSRYGGQYEGQFNFEAVAWTAPMRLTVTSSATDDRKGRIVWKIARAEPTGVIWANDKKSPEGQYVEPNKGLVIGGYATASNGRHAIALTLTPAYSVDDDGRPLACKSESVTKTYKCTAVDKPEAATPPVLAKSVTWYVTVSLTMANISGVWEERDKTVIGPPTVTIDANKDLCFTQPASSAPVYTAECREASKPFTYGGAWTANLTSK